MAFASGYPKEFEQIHNIVSFELVEVNLSSLKSPILTKIESTGPIWQIMKPDSNQIYCSLLLTNYEFTIQNDERGKYLRAQLIFDTQQNHKLRFKTPLDMYKACKMANDTFDDIHTFAKTFNSRRTNIVCKGFLFTLQAPTLEHGEFQMKYNPDTSAVSVKITKNVGEAVKAVFLTNIKESTILHYGFEIPESVNSNFLSKIIVVYNATTPAKKFFFICSSYPESMTIALNYCMDFFLAGGRQPISKNIIIPEQVLISPPAAPISVEPEEETHEHSHHKHHHRTPEELEAKRKEREKKRAESTLQSARFNLLPAEPDNSALPPKKIVSLQNMHSSVPPPKRPPPPPSVPPPSYEPEPGKQQIPAKQAPIVPNLSEKSQPPKIELLPEPKKVEEPKKQEEIKKEEPKLPQMEIQKATKPEEPKKPVEEPKKTQEVQKEPEEVKKPVEEPKSSPEPQKPPEKIKTMPLPKKSVPEMKIEIKELQPPSNNSVEKRMSIPKLVFTSQKAEEPEKKKVPRLAFNISPSSENLLSKERKQEIPVTIPQEKEKVVKEFKLPPNMRVSLSRRYQETMQSRKEATTRKSTVHKNFIQTDLSFLKEAKEPPPQPKKVEKPKLLPGKFEAFMQKHGKTTKEVKKLELPTLASLASSSIDFKTNSKLEENSIASLLENCLEKIPNTFQDPFSSFDDFNDLDNENLIEKTIETTTSIKDSNLFESVKTSDFSHASEEDFKYASTPQTPFLTEILSVNEGIISSGASRISDSNSSGLQFIISTMLINGFKGASKITDNLNFLDAYDELAQYVPIISECVSKARKGIDFGQQVSLFTQNLLNSCSFMRTIRTAVIHSQWLRKYYSAGSLLRNYNDLEMVLSILQPLLLTHEVEISENPVILSDQTPNNLQRFAFTECFPHILLEDSINQKDQLVQSIKSVFHNGLRPPQISLAAGLQKKGVKAALSQIIEENHQDEDWPEFKRVVSGAQSITDVIVEGLKKKKLHKWFAFIVLSRDILQKHYFDESPFLDFYKAKKIYTILEHLSRR
ncbi:hypothetical protein TVAG_426270 [Trichomonas vaginalis G3]|uniref:RUN domain-containing protein n=1 Tax=Trichomonas vaginalis (strain ATCC PRA-98 / G3) TaxID=412133 RepID=A2DYP4_TRIV3|nr:hypothetical protein TVAGG3_0850660 [Trichomonas vaginalis G3]EAY14434.1 hypothetical protein TVAG_426270 [Trichomonas vaginalis G3]KAI5499960.1 hypothetical protein TVAGG3_0850660 [Trichomonas vaginalis G3]|eukprot:XP_001326657.1 hypothetical protein [Trichomonas vaginalis G3]